VPKNWTTSEGEELQTVLKPRGETKVTRVSQLPSPPKSQPFHIGNLTLHTQIEPGDCDRAIIVMGQLVEEGKIKAIVVHGNWFLFLSLKFAEDALKTIQISGEGGLLPGESAPDWIVRSSTLIFLLQLQDLVGQGIWLDFRVSITQICLQAAGEQELLQVKDKDAAPTEHKQPGNHWYHTLVSIQLTGLVSTQNVTLMTAYPPLKVYNVCRRNSIMLFGNSIYTKATQLHNM
jgi:hypothetical protein